MFEIYLLTRLDAINDIFNWMLGISCAAIVVWAFMAVVTAEEFFMDTDTIKYTHKMIYRYFKKIIFPIFIVGLLGSTFCPTKTDALLIYGVGGSIDYLRNNPVAKKLPDKCIDALDKWIEELSKEDSKNK